MNASVVMPGRRVALFIDGDNIPVDYAGHLLVRASGLGRVNVKRVYLDLNHFRNWESAAGFTPTVVRGGRDAADKHLLIDAVDLFHRGGFDSAVIASTDGGYAPLGRFLVERGVMVLGIGSKEASLDWRKSCSMFEELPERKAAVTTPLSRAPRTDTGETQAQQPCEPALLPAGSALRAPSTSDRKVGDAGDALDQTDQAIRELIRTNGAEWVISIGTLGHLMRTHDENALTRLRVTRWRQYLETKAKLYQLDPPSATARVRWIGA